MRWKIASETADPILFIVLLHSLPDRAVRLAAGKVYYATEDLGFLIIIVTDMSKSWVGTIPRQSTPS